MKGYEILSKTLESLNLLEVFGNPVTTEIPFLRSIKNYYLTLHDSISVGMGDGYAQYNGSASLVNLHTLPGLGNSMAFINTAKANRSPVIITAGQQDTRHLVFDPLLSGDLLSLISGSVKYKYEIKNPEDIPFAMKRARSIAMAPPRGPVFISFPMDMLDYQGEYYEQANQKIDINFGDNDTVKEICNKINNSRNPAVVFGYEIDVYNAFEEAKKFSEILGVPVYSEPLSSRSTFDTSLYIYNGDLLPASTMMNLKLMENDLIVFIGGDITFYPYLPSKPFINKEVIFIGTDLSYRIGESYFMNPKLFLENALKFINKKGNFKSKPDYMANTEIAAERTTMGVGYVLNKAKTVYSDYTVVDEAISHSEKVRAIFGYNHKKYFTAKSGQLGWASAASLGIAINNPKVLVIIGDGSFMYTIQSLWTAKRYNLPVKFLVLNNSGYNILKSFSKSYYPGVENSDYFRLNLDIANISRGFGIETEIASNDMNELNWLKEGNIPKVLIVNIDKTVEKMFL